MKLYDSRLAPNPRRVRWLMAEKGVEDIEVVPFDIMTGEHRTPDYRQRAGLPHVPALELDDGVVITESLAICRYLEALYPEPNLFGADAREQALIEMWTRRVEIYLANPLMMMVRHTHPALVVLEKPVPGIADYNRETAEAMMRRIDRQLADNAYIAGERFTIADIIALCGVDFARIVKYRPDPALENLGRWIETVRQRPAAKAGM